MGGTYSGIYNFSGGVGMKPEERRNSEIYLAWIYGQLNTDRDDLDNIPNMTDEELDRAIASRGELVGWR